MIAKMTIIWPLLLLAGFISFSSSNPTDKNVIKTFLDSHDEALAACMIDNTTQLIRRFQGVSSPFGCSDISHVECFCSIACYVQSVGLINDGGVNKLAVNWTRDWVDFIYHTENTTGMVPFELVMRYIETGFDLSHKFIQPINDACTAKNETALDIIFETIKESMRENHLIQDKFIPSEEESPMFELILNAMNKCSTKVNSSPFTLAFKYTDHREQLYKNKYMCFDQCMLLELNIVSETGLNEPLAGTVRDLFNKEAHYDVKPVLDDLAILLNSKCSTDLNELPEFYFSSAFEEMDSKQEKSPASKSE